MISPFQARALSSRKEQAIGDANQLAGRRGLPIWKKIRTHNLSKSEACRIVLALGLLLQFATAEDKGVSWATIDPFCGQVTSAEPAEFPISSAKIKLYRAKAKDLPCCRTAEQLDDVKIDKSGKFDLRKIAPGQYWLIVAWKTVEVPVALWYDGNHDFACDERYKNLIEIKPSTKTVERLVMTATDSSANAKTN